MRKKYVRVGFTAAQSSELWDRWQKGEGLNSIGRALGKPSSCPANVPVWLMLAVAAVHKIISETA